MVSKADGIISITGTIGFESYILDENKPVIIFGDTFYDVFPHIFKINDFNLLPELFQKIKKIKNNKNGNCNELTINIAAYLQSLFEGRAGYDGTNLATTENIISVGESMDTFIQLLEDQDIAEYMRKYSNET